MTGSNDVFHPSGRGFSNSSNLPDIESRVVSPTFSHTTGDAMVTIQRLENPFYTSKASINFSSNEKPSDAASCLSIGRIEDTLSHTLERLMPTALSSVIQLGCGSADVLTALNSENLLETINSTICAHSPVVSNQNCLLKLSPSTSTKSQKCVKGSNSVEKRNARERIRVHTVNQAFGLLKSYLPSIKANTKRVSKLKILRAAVKYIYSLDRMLGSNTDAAFLKFISNYENSNRKSAYPKSVERNLTAELTRCRTPSPANMDGKSDGYVPAVEAALMQHLNASGLRLSPHCSSSTSFEPLASSSNGIIRSCAPLFSSTGLLAFNECASLFGDTSRNLVANSLTTTNFEFLATSIAFQPMTNVSQMSQSHYI